MQERPELDADSDVDTAGVDWRASVNDTLEAVDQLLKAHGLEIVNYDTGADFYQFSVEKRNVEAA